MTENKPSQELDDDPRSVSDDNLRNEHTREEVTRWRDEAQAQHERWLDVMRNSYGKG